MHQRGIGAPVGLVPHVGDGKREIDKAMAGERERYVVERLQQRADNDMRLAVVPPWRDHACKVG